MMFVVSNFMFWTFVMPFWYVVTRSEGTEYPMPDQVLQTQNAALEELLALQIVHEELLGVSTGFVLCYLVAEHGVEHSKRLIELLAFGRLVYCTAKTWIVPVYWAIIEAPLRDHRSVNGWETVIRTACMVMIQVCVVSITVITSRCCFGYSAFGYFSGKLLMIGLVSVSFSGAIMAWANLVVRSSERGSNIFWLHLTALCSPAIDACVEVFEFGCASIISCLVRGAVTRDRNLLILSLLTYAATNLDRFFMLGGLQVESDGARSASGTIAFVLLMIEIPMAALVWYFNLRLHKQGNPAVLSQIGDFDLDLEALQDWVQSRMGRS